ncbi:MAG: hypothetical protein SGCHY_005136 [Lobulomycetales sp.]
MLKNNSKAKTARGKRVLQSREAQTEEGAKTAVFLKTMRTSEKTGIALKDLFALKKPRAIMFNKRNDIHPFTDHSSLSFFAEKNQASLFCIASHSKKRPDCITLCRTFDHQTIDMLEFTVLSAIPMEVFEASKPAVGVRPMIVFQGSLFETGEFAKVKDFFLDFFRGEPTSEIDHVKGLQNTISISIDPETRVIHIRSYVVKSIQKSKVSSGSPDMQVKLEECGPALKLQLQRREFCPDAVMKVATYIPKELKPKKLKNVGVDVLGDRKGRIHMKPQNLDEIQTRKMKGLKKRKSENGDPDSGSGNKKVRTNE